MDNVFVPKYRDPLERRDQWLRLTSEKKYRQEPLSGHRTICTPREIPDHKGGDVLNQITLDVARSFCQFSSINDKDRRALQGQLQQILARIFSESSAYSYYQV